MIYRDKRDQEAWLREKSLDSLKTNPYLQENDIVQVASDNNFYKVVSATTNIALANNLFAQIIPSEIVGNISTADKLKTARNISLTGDITGTGSFDGSQDLSINATIKEGVISNIDASKITSGVLDIARIPQGALERCVVVADDTARFNLTTSQVQLGDTVKVTSTNKMYFVIDETKLNAEAGYTVYTAGTATEVPWSGVTGKPSTFTPASHTHTKAQITDFPASLKNPTALTISLNGTSQGAYDGSAAKSINVTPASIGTYTQSEIDTKVNAKANASHNHASNAITAMTGYAKASAVSAIAVGDSLNAAIGKLEKSLDGKAASSHTHTKAQITDFPASLKNPTALTISLNGTSQGAYDGSSAISVNVTAGGVGAYTKAEVDTKVNAKANASHNHASNAITAMTGYAKASAVAAVAASDSLNTAIGKIEKALDSKQASGSYMPLSGNSTKSGSLTVTGEILSNGNVTAYSDEKVKKNIRPLQDDVIEKLQLVKFYNYEMINDPKQITRVGVKAQELKELFPELVEKDSNGILVVNYIGLNTYFSFAMQKVLGDLNVTE